MIAPPYKIRRPSDKHMPKHMQIKNAICPLLTGKIRRQKNIYAKLEEMSCITKRKINAPVLWEGKVFENDAIIIKETAHMSGYHIPLLLMKREGWLHEMLNPYSEMFHKLGDDNMVDLKENVAYCVRKIQETEKVLSAKEKANRLKEFWTIWDTLLENSKNEKI